MPARRLGHVAEVDQLDDAASGWAGSPRNTARSVGDGRPEQRGPVALEALVHERLEAEAVAPEPQAGVDVADADRGVVDDGHCIEEFRL